MTAPDSPTLDALLRSCADAAPAPWRPGEYARASGVERDSLDEPLNQLRLSGLIRLTEWEPGLGQGYVLTDAGAVALADGRTLARLRDGSIEPPTQRRAAPPAADTFERGEQIRAAVFNPNTAPMTRLLIAVQVIVFAAGLYLALRHKVPLHQYLLDGHSDLRINGKTDIIEELAVHPLALSRGQWWLLLTYALVHGGGLHLVMNLYAHWAIGPAVEGMLGSVRFLFLWLISALGGGFLVALNGQSAVGSSGAVCGLIGALAAFVALYHAHIGRRATLAFRGWLAQTVLILVLFSLMPGISWAGHLGGALFGLLAGGLLGVNRFGPPIWRLPALLGALALPIFAIGFLSERGVLKLVASVHEVEHEDFAGRLRPQVDDSEKFAREIQDEVVDPLRDHRPELRHPDDIRSAVATLKQLREREVQVLTLVAETGSYKTESLEAARKAAGTLLRLRIEVSRHYEECFRRGDLWNLEKDEAGLQALLNETLEAEILYRRKSGEV